MVFVSVVLVVLPKRVARPGWSSSSLESGRRRLVVLTWVLGLCLPSVVLLGGGLGSGCGLLCLLCPVLAGAGSVAQFSLL